MDTGAASSARQGGIAGTLRENWVAWLVLALLFAGALFVRAYFNIDGATGGGEDFRWSGTDGYYHSRAQEHIADTGESLTRDEMINYPVGATNPRPPLFNWFNAIASSLLAQSTGMDSEKAMGYVSAWSPAVWGALIVFPVYAAGCIAFGRRSGLWAAFFVAFMAANLQRSGLGGFDHDSQILFFIALGVVFVLKGIQAIPSGTLVERWGDAASVKAGVVRLLRDHKASWLNFALAGISWAAVALTWQGWAYVFALYAAYYAAQLLTNHLKGRDSSAWLVNSLILCLVSLALIWPYYSAVSRISSYVMPAVYIMLGMLLLSVIFVPTRNFPPVMVLPITIGGALAALLVLRFVFTDLWTLYSTGLGYFVQTKLYTTIAEAQRTELGFFAFAVGIIPWVFAFVGLGFMVKTVWKRHRWDHLYLLVFSLVSIYMGFAASRFVYNASVSFALLAGWVTVRFLDRIQFGAIARTWRGVRASSGFFKSVRASVKVRHVLAAVFLVFLVVFPQVWLGVDAGMPGQYADRVARGNPDLEKFLGKHFGAFGQDFLSGTWVEALAWLRSQDGDVTELAQRPAFLAWWDYGFYAVDQGKHPTVADPFQFGYLPAGLALASQSEQELQVIMAFRLLEGNINHNRGTLTPEARATLSPWLTDAEIDEVTAHIRVTDYTSAYDIFVPAMAEPGEELPSDANATAFLRSVGEANQVARSRITGEVGIGSSIRYLAVDGRMFPYDDPATDQVDSGSIFYAPVFLAEKNPDDFVKTTYVDLSGGEYNLQLYRTDPATGHSVALDRPRIVDLTGREYVASGGLLVRAPGGRIDFDDPGVQLRGTQLTYDDSFYGTNFYKAWFGPSPEQTGQPDRKVPGFEFHAPGYGLKHWRLVYSNSQFFTHGVTILKYYEGAALSGRVTADDGTPLPGLGVRVLSRYDTLGAAGVKLVAQDFAETDADGRYRLLAPFSTEGDVRGGPNLIQVVRGGDVIAFANLTVGDDQAMNVPGAEPLASMDFSIPYGSLSGVVYEDVDGDGAYVAGNDTGLAGATVTLGDRNVTTGASGAWTMDKVLAGRATVSGSLDGYVSGSGSAQIPPGGAATIDVALRVAPITVTGNATFEGTGVEGVTVAFDPDEADAANVTSSVTTPSGSYTATLPPGRYGVTVNFTTTENGTEYRYFLPAGTTLTVPFAAGEMTFDLALSREETGA